MSINGLLFLVVAIVVAAIAVAVHYLRGRPVSDEQLREWLSFVRKPSGKPSTERLLSHEYDAIRLLFHPALRAEFEEKQTRLDNDFSARAIETALVIRRQAKGLPMSEADDRVLIREGLRSDGRDKKKTVDPIGGSENDLAENDRNEDEAFPGNLATFRGDAVLRSTDGG